MPVLTLHFIRLGPFISVPAFLQLVQSHAPDIEILLASRPKFKIVSPQETDVDMLKPRYELVLLVKRSKPFWPGEIQGSLYRDYSIHIGAPSPLVDSHASRTAETLQRYSSAEPDSFLSGAVSKYQSQPEPQRDGRIDPKILAFAERMAKSADAGKPVTMINLLRFHGTAESRATYAEYGRQFQKVGEKRGASIRIVGKVIEPSAEAKKAAAWGEEGRRYGAGEWWDEISVVQYPSVDAFCDLMACDEYVAINQRYRLAALKDTFLVCSVDMDLTTDKGRL